MYYVLFETGNDVFFSRIVDAFCSVVARSILDIIKDAQPDGAMTDANLVEKLEKSEWVLRPLSCGLFPAVYCGNQECAGNSIAALTSGQLDKFEPSMTHTSAAFLKANAVFYNLRERIRFQRILQSYKIVNIQGIEHIPIEKRGDHAEYLRSYIKKTDALKSKADGFVYVRAGAASDYDYFKAHTSLPNVSPCDCFQRVTA